MPIVTASMITAARTALGRSENSGASAIRVRTTMPPVLSEATGLLAPELSLSELAERLVETGIPWISPAPMFAIPCATVSWSMSTR